MNRWVLHCYTTYEERQHAMNVLKRERVNGKYVSLDDHGVYHQHLVIRDMTDAAQVRGMVYEQIHGIDNVPGELRDFVASRLRARKVAEE